MLEQWTEKPNWETSPC